MTAPRLTSIETSALQWFKRGAWSQSEPYPTPHGNTIESLQRKGLVSCTPDWHVTAAGDDALHVPNIFDEDPPVASDLGCKVCGIRAGVLACSFCLKTAEEVAHLVAGPRAHICDECIALAASVVAEQRAKEPR